MKLIDSCKCNFCYIYEQDIYHLLYDCFKVKNFWFDVNSCFNKLKGTNYVFLKYDIFFGHQSGNEDLDRFILAAKYFIVTSKYRNEVPKLLAFERFFKNIQYFC